MTTSVQIAPNGTSLTGPRVAVVVYDGLCTFEYGVAYEVFGLPRPEAGPGWYRFSTVAAEAGPMRAAGGLAIVDAAGLDELVGADLVVVPGWRGLDAAVPASLSEALRFAARRGARIASLCSGAVVLAASGLLDGRRATTHWRYLEALSSRYPTARFVSNVLYVEDGPVMTAAGSAAAIDLSLHIVRRDFGPGMAVDVARRLVVPPHREGSQAQYIPRPVARASEGARLGPLLDRMRKDPAVRYRLRDLADEAGMSLRTFQRRFRETTGEAPGTWLIAERLRLARDLLEEGATRVEDVALRAGFGTPEILRHHFRSTLGVSPSRYRAQFSRAVEIDAIPGIRGDAAVSAGVGWRHLRRAISCQHWTAYHERMSKSELNPDGDRQAEPRHSR